jgi:hypothetical protein
MKNKKLDSIIHEVEHYFGFLHDKGFRTSSAEYSQQFNGNWVIEFESSDCKSFITSDRNYIILEFSSIKNQDVGRRMTIEDIIYLISNGRTAVKPFDGNLAWGKKKQLERLSLLLKEHIDQIMLFYRSEENSR